MQTEVVPEHVIVVLFSMPGDEHTASSGPQSHTTVAVASAHPQHVKTKMAATTTTTTQMRIIFCRGFPRQKAPLFTFKSSLILQNLKQIQFLFFVCTHEQKEKKMTSTSATNTIHFPRVLPPRMRDEPCLACGAPMREPPNPNKWLGSLCTLCNHYFCAGCSAKHGDHIKYGAHYPNGDRNIVYVCVFCDPRDLYS
jgi:hypothetical protein